MHVEQLLVTTANGGQYANLVRDASQVPALQKLQAAVAYATNSGVAELCRVLDALPDWRTSRKQWLIGIDYCRSDPLALAHLSSLHRSEVRIYDGAFVAKRAGCFPRVSYHPKLYIFHGNADIATVVGSGNLSRTGLRIGIEAATSLRSTDANELIATTRWYRTHWGAATPYASVEKAYIKQYEANANKKQPAPVEDDTAPTSAGGRGQLTPAQLRQLRVCKHLWIEVGNLHENRGVGQPGNQLMLKRNMRVFFGFQAQDLARDTTIGSVAIRYGGNDRDDCSLRFSNNSMDVLTLPIPGLEGPAQYDQEVILFTRIGVRKFELSVGNAAKIRAWRRNSDAIGADLKMASGRRWGMF